MNLMVDMNGTFREIPDLFEFWSYNPTVFLRKATKQESAVFYAPKKEVSQ